MKELSPELEIEICRQYAKYGISNLMIKFNIGKKRIADVLTKNGVSIRTKAENQTRRREFTYSLRKKGY